MSKRTAGRTGEGGFSVVELVVVIALILILSAISLPALFRSIRNYEIRGGASEVAAEIQRARMTAVMKNVRYGVVFVVRGSKEYQFVIEDLQDAAAKAAATSAADFYAKADTEDRDQLGPRRLLPGQIVFGTDCPGFAPTNNSMRFGRLGTMCEPSGTASPRQPGTCPAIENGPETNLVQYDAGAASFCLQDPRGLARTVVVTPGGRVQILDTVLGS